MYLKLKKKARKVACNPFLKHWSSNAPEYSFEQFNSMIGNLRSWLEPTASRLIEGLKILEEHRKSGINLKINPVIETFKENIFDEQGQGDSSKAHELLFLYSSENYCVKVYGQSLKRSEIFEQTIRLKKTSEVLFQGTMNKMLGATIAQEIHALPQLELLLQGLHLNRKKFTSYEWTEVSYFYDIHLDGTEARHAENLNRTIWKLIDTEEKKNTFLEGFNVMLSAIASFWTGLEKEIIP